ncbi:MAG: Rid family hydrolase [Gemmatimonadales bacterium]|nr:Rid family hydrolase [Gemmatimonadales bacterium]
MTKPGRADRVRRGVASLLLALAAQAATLSAQAPATRLNPDALSRPTGYSHVAISPDGRTAWISGQVALDSTGALVGAGDVRVQAEQVYANLQRALRAVGADFHDILKTTTYLVDASRIADVRAVRARWYGDAAPPASTAVIVPALFNPAWLVEVEAVVAIPVPPAEAATRTIRALNARYDTAMLVRDTAMLASLLAPEFVTVHPGGVSETRAQAIASLSRGDVRMTTGGSDSVEVTLLGPDHAMVVGRFTGRGTARGKPFRLRERYLGVWARRDGRWWLVREQGTALP